MKTIRFKNDRYLLVSVNDVIDYVQKELNISDKKISIISWEFKKEIIYDLYKEYKAGSVFNSLIIPDHDDYFLSWTRFWRLEKILNKKGYSVYKLFQILSDPNEIELNSNFEQL